MPWKAQRDFSFIRRCWRGAKRLCSLDQLNPVQDKCQHMLKGTQSYQFHITISNVNSLIFAKAAANNGLTLMRRDWWISAASSPFHHCSSLSIFPIQRRLHGTRVTCRDTRPKLEHIQHGHGGPNYIYIGFSFQNWEFASTNPSDESSTDTELKRNLDAITQTLEVGLRNTMTRCLLKWCFVLFFGKSFDTPG